MLRMEWMVSTKIGVQNCALGYNMYQYNLHVMELAFNVVSGRSKDMLPTMGSIGKVVGRFFKFLMGLNSSKDSFYNERPGTLMTWQSSPVISRAINVNEPWFT